MIRPAINSLRLRLAVWCVACVVCLLLVHAALTLALTRVQTLRDIDRALMAELTLRAERHARGADVQTTTAAQVRRGSSAGRPAVDAWALDEAGMPDRRLPLEADAPAAVLPAPDVSLPANSGYDLMTAAGEMRTAHVVAGEGAAAVMVRASLPLEPLDALTENLLWSAGLGLPGLLIAACAAGLLISGAAVAPLADIIRRLESIRPVAPVALAARLPTVGMPAEVVCLSDAINELLACEQNAHRKQARFATEAAHELRTPLTAQRSVGELALRANATLESLSEAVSSMLEQSQHMQNLVDSLLLVARAEGGMLGTPTTTIDASELAEGAVRNMLPLAEQKSQSLSVQAQDRRLVVAEATLLRQAVLNLIHNAIVHTPENTRIDVGVRTNAEGEVVVSIIDDGPGFSAYEPGQVVHRYARRQEDRMGCAGLGLGLTIALSLVHSQGGKMIVDSRPGFGTAIRLHFPASDGPVSSTEPARFGRRRGDQRDGTAGGSKRRPSVLTAVLKGGRR